MVGRIVGSLSGGRQAAKVCDDSHCIVIAQFAGVGVGHDDQPVPIFVDAVANGPKNVSIRPAAKLPGGSEVGGHKRSERHWKVLGDIETTGERGGFRMAAAAEAVGYRPAAHNLFGPAGNLQVGGGGAAGRQPSPVVEPYY